MKYTGMVIDNKTVLDFLTRKQMYRAVGARPCHQAAFPDRNMGPGRRFYFCDTRVMASGALTYATRNPN